MDIGQMIVNPPIAMTIAGSDCSAGAGLQADLKTFHYFQVHGLSAVTCVVSETAQIVRAVHPVPVEMVRDQVTLLLESFPVAALKTGMLFSAAHVRAVAEILRAFPGVAIVVDPVMVASTGDSLLESGALAAYRDALLPMARVVTPNLPEAEVLLERPLTRPEQLEPAARELADRLGTAVLLKGGHLAGPDCIDWLVDGAEATAFRAGRIVGAASHGTGCTLAAAITAGLAHGQALPQAIHAAKRYLGRCLSESHRFVSATGVIIDALNQGTCFRRDAQNGA